jgi:hypothetical protein
VRLLPAALIAVALAGCGAGEDAADGTEPREAAPEGPAISLEVTVWPTGRANGPRHVTTLECDPVGGNHPAPEESCRTLTANPDLLEPVPEDVMCTQQFGGPEQARVRGAYRGRELDLRYSRANGCEISRWDRLAPLFKVVV